MWLLGSVFAIDATTTDLSHHALWWVAYSEMVPIATIRFVDTWRMGERKKRIHLFESV